MFITGYSEVYVKNERLRYALKIHKADIHSLLKTMCIEGLLFSDGHGRGTKYYLLDSANAGRNLERNLGSNIGSLESNLGSNIGSNLESNIGSNLESNFKRRMSRKELYKVIIETCSNWVSLEYISKTIGRSPYYLLNEIIPSMLDEGLLERMYPNTPRHPNQKYKKR